jgi:hypothetical protein
MSTGSAAGAMLQLELPPRPESVIELDTSTWTADERTVPKIKSQEAVRIPRNADPNALPDFAGFVVTASEP